MLGARPIYDLWHNRLVPAGSRILGRIRAEAAAAKDLRRATHRRQPKRTGSFRKQSLSVLGSTCARFLSRAGPQALLETDSVQRGYDLADSHSGLAARSLYI